MDLLAMIMMCVAAGKIWGGWGVVLVGCGCLVYFIHSITED